MALPRFRTSLKAESTNCASAASQGKAHSTTWKNEGSQENLGFPRVLLGFPRVFLGFPRVFLGFPRVFLGFPRVLLGFRRVFLGFPRVFLGFPRVFLGFPRVLLGFPRVFLGFPKVLLGFPRVFLGFPRVFFKKVAVKVPYRISHNSSPLAFDGRGSKNCQYPLSTPPQAPSSQRCT